MQEADPNLPYPPMHFNIPKGSTRMFLLAWEAPEAEIREVFRVLVLFIFDVNWTDGSVV